MLQFSFWDILSNLLIATLWTIVLSLIAFVCGGIVGLALLVSPWIAAKKARRSTLYCSSGIRLFGAEILARLRRGDPQGRMGGVGQPRLSFLEQMRHVILPQASRIAIPPTVFSPHPINETAPASDHRLRRAVAGRPDDQQRDLPAVHGLRAGRR